jgi:hypothetical protein
VTEWLLAHQAQLQTDLLLGSFGIVVVWEALAARRAELTPVGIRWFNNLALAALGIAVGGC